ncbi:MAG: glycosyltransferase family 4 protein [Candidatus Omnitrophica bacterium]|nr:glycosyltransferase family 4 protein [Candidatus Omnitrophota bacterium]
MRFPQLNNRNIVTVIHPADPLGPKVGGVESFIKGIIKYAPSNFTFFYIGVTSDNNIRKVRILQKIELDGKSIYFYPLFIEENENIKSLVPLSLRFTLFLLFHLKLIPKSVLFFNRIEPAILFLKWKSKKVFVIHNDMLKQLKKGNSEVLWSNFPKLYYFLESIILDKFNFIFSVNINSLNFYNKRYPKLKNKMKFIPTWVDSKVFFPLNVEKSELIKNRLEKEFKIITSNGPWVLFVGRLQLQKAPMKLVETFLEFREKNDNAVLIIVGDGNLRGQLECYVDKHNLRNCVYLLGNLTQMIVADFYRASDVFVLTSNFEGMPISVLEALGSGLPVVSTCVGEVERVITAGFSGEIAYSGTVEELTNSINKVVINRERYSKVNCVSSIAEFVPEKVLNDLYEKLNN